ADGGRAVIDGPHGAVPAREQGVVGQHDLPAFAERAGDGVLDGAAYRLINDPEDRFEGLAGRLLLRVAGQGLRDAVEEGDPALRVGGDRAVADAVEGAAQELALRAGLAFGPPAAQQRLDVGDQLARLDRVGEIAVRAAFEPLGPILALDEARRQVQD